MNMRRSQDPPPEAELFDHMCDDRERLRAHKSEIAADAARMSKVFFNSTLRGIAVELSNAHPAMCDYAAQAPIVVLYMCSGKITINKGRAHVHEVACLEDRRDRAQAQRNFPPLLYPDGLSPVRCSRHLPARLRYAELCAQPRQPIDDRPGDTANRDRAAPLFARARLLAKAIPPTDINGARRPNGPCARSGALPSCPPASAQSTSRFSNRCTTSAILPIKAGSTSIRARHGIRCWRA